MELLFITNYSYKKVYMYIIVNNCMSHEHNNCDIDFEKHTQFLHVNHSSAT